MAISKQAKSAVPRVSAGGSYGFAWERKKVRNKQREIKREVQTQAASCARASTDPGPHPGIRPELAPATLPTVAVVGHAGDPSQGEEAGREAAAALTGEDAGTPVFDQFSYLTAGASGAEDDPVSSFFER
jgi:hypothetical protein